MTKRCVQMLIGALALSAPVWAQDPHGATAKPAAAAKTKPDASVLKGAPIGKPAPDFALKDLEGKDVKLADFKGKVVVLEWINHECPVVNRVHAAHTMTDTLDKFKGKPVVWLAINSSSFIGEKAAEAKKWMEEKKITYPMLLDADGKVGKAYGATNTPHMFVIDQKGNLAYAGAIDNEPTTEDKAQVRNYVGEAVTSLLAGSTVATPETKAYGCTVKYKG